MAADFAAINQGGDPTTLRDDAAALQQIATEGGARTNQMMGQVGRAWGSYGETRPGSIGFMTGQNISQVARDAIQAGEDASAQLIKDLADNPQEAIQMWSTLQEAKNAKTKAAADTAQQEFENQLKLKQEEREQKAFELTVQKYNMSVGKQFFDQAQAMSKASGWIYRYNPKTHQFVNTGKHTVDWTKAHSQIARNTALNNQGNRRLDIQQQNADTNSRRADIAQQKANNAATGKGKSLTPNQVATFTRQYQRDAYDGALAMAGSVNGAPPQGMPPKRAYIISKLYATLAPALLGQNPAWTDASLHKYIRDIVNALPQDWWNLKAKERKSRSVPPGSKKTSTSGGPGVL
jgi:hypothetical protein